MLKITQITFFPKQLKKLFRWKIYRLLSNIYLINIYGQRYLSFIYLEIDQDEKKEGKGKEYLLCYSLGQKWIQEIANIWWFEKISPEVWYEYKGIEEVSGEIILSLYDGDWGSKVYCDL